MARVPCPLGDQDQEFGVLLIIHRDPYRYKGSSGSAFFIPSVAWNPLAAPRTLAKMLSAATLSTDSRMDGTMKVTVPQDIEMNNVANQTHIQKVPLPSHWDDRERGIDPGYGYLDDAAA